MVVGLAVLATVGCGTKKRLDTVPVSGTVTLDGTAVEGASVVFAPTKSGGMAASGATDASGRYKLTTRDPNDGALAGSYSVMVSKTEVQGSASEAFKPGMSREEAEKVAEAYRKAPKGKKAATQTKEHLPAKYKNPATSDFKADVIKGGQTEFNFELKSK
jgi:hypothetical protein